MMAVVVDGSECSNIGLVTDVPETKVYVSILVIKKRIQTLFDTYVINSVVHSLRTLLQASVHHRTFRMILKCRKPWVQRSIP